jgi:hypothetical protein
MWCIVSPRKLGTRETFQTERCSRRKYDAFPGSLFSLGHFPLQILLKYGCRHVPKLLEEAPRREVAHLRVCSSVHRYLLLLLLGSGR